MALDPLTKVEQSNRVSGHGDSAHLSFSQKVHDELNLLGSLPSRIDGGLVDRLETLAAHPGQAQAEFATSFGVSAVLGFLAKDAGIVGDVARLAPKLLVAATGVDLLRRFAQPMWNTWQHPANLQGNKLVLADNVGAAALDYPIAIAGGILGAGLSLPLAHFDSLDIGKLKGAEPVHEGFFIHAMGVFNAPSVLLAENLNRPYDPNFPKTVNVPGLQQFPTLQNSQSTAMAVPAATKLTNGKQTLAFGFNAPQSEQVSLDMKMSGPGTDWAKKGDESAVASVYVDGKYEQDAVLYAGSKPYTYDFNLENVKAGHHTVEVKYAPEKSTAGAKGIEIDSASASTDADASATQKLADKYAPIVYGRNGVEENHTDTPLQLAYNISGSPKGYPTGSRTINYQLFYTNEDEGSTNPPENGMALLGRLADIDDDVRVVVGPNGKVLNETFNAPSDTFIPFGGAHQGTHPVVRVDNLDNMLADYGSGPLRYQFTPQQLPAGQPRENQMYMNPLWYQLSSEEALRENKVRLSGAGSGPTNPGDLAGIYLREALLGYQPKMEDPRDYLYVQMHLLGAGAGNPVNTEVTLKNGKTYSSDLGDPSLAIVKSGWYQTAVPLPPGTTAASVKDVHFQALGKGQGKAVGVGNIFMLDKQFEPAAVNVPVALQRQS